jgi:serine/threonine protein kinase
VKSLGDKHDWSDFDIQLCDFGMSGYHDPTQPNPLGYIGTTLYWPPEVTWEDKKLSPASDVWGTAAIIHYLAHDFLPIVDPDLAKRKWFLQNDDSPYPHSWTENLKSNYWTSKSPRRVVPINVEPDRKLPILSDPKFGVDTQAMLYRRIRPSLKYSDELNGCMLLGLTMSQDERPESGKLLRRIEEAHAEILFQGLRLEHEVETEME